MDKQLRDQYRADKIESDDRIRALEDSVKSLEASVRELSKLLATSTATKSESRSTDTTEGKK